MCEKERYPHIYCLFCRSGTEQRISEAIERRHAHIRALAAVQEKHRYTDRRYEIDRQRFLPGYLFCTRRRKLNLRVYSESAMHNFKLHDKTINKHNQKCTWINDI